MWDAIAFGALIQAKRGQMGLTQAQLAERIFGSLSRKGEVSQVENAKVIPQEDTIQKYLDFFNISAAEMIPIRMARPAAEQLRDIPALSREALPNLAARFGLNHPYDLPDGELRRSLTMKADEYRSLKAEVDQIDEGLKRLSKLKTAVQDAIARVDLEEVEELLGRVQEVELEEAAKTAEMRAQNALLRGNAEQAHRLLSSAADSFVAIDPVEPARKRIDYAQRLHAHGMRFGGPALEYAVSMNRVAAVMFGEDAHPREWGVAQNYLGRALQEQGSRSTEESGQVQLAEAVDTYCAALRVLNEVEYPVDWAKVKLNHGVALQEQGIRAEDELGRKLLAEAADSYCAALQIFTEAAHPSYWATTKNNLGNALRNLGIRTGVKAGAAFLAEAAEAYHAALRIHTEVDYPLNWAMTQNNLATRSEIRVSA